MLGTFISMLATRPQIDNTNKLFGRGGDSLSESSFKTFRVLVPRPAATATADLDSEGNMYTVKRVVQKTLHPGT